MVISVKYLSFLFLLTLLSSLHIHARESQFFSKVTTNNNNAKPTEVPNKEEPLSKQEQEPSFIPETQNGYGLYGHESGQFPPTTTTTTTPTNGAPYTTTNLPYKTESENPSNDNYYYNKDAYVTEPQSMSDTRFMGGYNNGGNNYNTQKQGLSDTRFLENGRYYYDLNTENNYRNGYQNEKGVGYNNKGYYGNNENSYEYNNSMEGYQNQEEYHESEDEFMP